ncbi:hypothetical protein [Candidatus Lokiarchaeum ossiferum]
MVETETILRDKICPKCGSKMNYRRRVSSNRLLTLLQCSVCRHYLVIDN